MASCRSAVPRTSRTRLAVVVFNDFPPETVAIPGQTARESDVFGGKWLVSRGGGRGALASCGGGGAGAGGPAPLGLSGPGDAGLRVRAPAGGPASAPNRSAGGHT